MSDEQLKFQMDANPNQRRINSGKWLFTVRWYLF